MPIWFILPVGLLIAGLGGVAVGWAYDKLLPKLLPRPWRTPALATLFAVILLPAIILAEIRLPVFDFSVPGDLLMMSVGRAAAIFILELPTTAILVAGMAGWIIGRTPRAVLATSLAGFTLALGPGHNIPFLGSTAVAGKASSSFWRSCFALQWFLLKQRLDFREMDLETLKNYYFLNVTACTVDGCLNTAGFHKTG